MISVTLNGDKLTLNQGSSLLNLVEAQGISPTSVAIVLNQAVVPRSRWPYIHCQVDDEIEFFTVVAGG